MELINLNEYLMLREQAPAKLDLLSQQIVHQVYKMDVEHILLKGRKNAYNEECEIKPEIYEFEMSQNFGEDPDPRVGFGFGCHKGKASVLIFVLNYDTCIDEAFCKYLKNVQRIEFNGETAVLFDYLPITEDFDTMGVAVKVIEAAKTLCDFLLK